MGGIVDTCLDALVRLLLKHHEELGIIKLWLGNGGFKQHRVQVMFLAASWQKVNATI